MNSDLWTNIFEQEKVKNELNRMLEMRRVPHAFIFNGPRGVGKFFTAVEFIKSLNSSIPNYNQVSEKIASLKEPYLKLIIPLPRGKNEGFDDSGTDKLSKESMELLLSEISKKVKNPYHSIEIDNANTIKISSIREIGKFVSLSSQENICRAIIIDHAHLMNDQAQNALLKNLEEPPENVFFFLLTHDKEKLLPTINSRCRSINFHPLSEVGIASILNLKFGIENKLAKKVSKLAEGSVYEAYKLLDNDLNSVIDETIEILRYCFAKKYSYALASLNKFIEENGEEALLLFFRIVKIWYNDAVKNKLLLNDYILQDHSETFEKFNQKFSNSNYQKAFTNIDILENLIPKKINLNVLLMNIIFELSSVIKRN